MELPHELQQHALETLIAARRPAWIRVDAAGSVLDHGGRLSSYGLQNLRRGQAAAIAFPCLEGALGSGREPTVLPMVALSRRGHVDVHIVPGSDGGELVLILEAEREAARRFQMQQALHEVLLALDAGDAMLPTVLDALDLLVLRRTAQGEYRRVGNLPRWAVHQLPHDDVLASDDLPHFVQCFLPDAVARWQRGGAGQLRSGPWTETTPDGETLTLEATAMSQGPGLDVLLIGRAGTEMREKQRIVQNAREQSLAHQRLQKELETREVLLHCIIHDLKAPLTGLVSVLELLAPAVSDPDDVELIRTGLRHTARQRRMIEDLTHAFAAEIATLQGAADSDAVADAARCASTVIDELRPAFIDDDLIVELHCDTAAVETGAPVHAETRHLERVVANLLENALRHTPEGGHVRVSLERVGDAVRLTVDNDGPQVPEELRGRLFDRFAQGRQHGGSAGLGLYFCRITVERWGGDIAYQPRPGGSRFVVTLRSAPAASAER